MEHLRPSNEQQRSLEKTIGTRTLAAGIIIMNSAEVIDRRRASKNIEPSLPTRGLYKIGTLVAKSGAILASDSYK